MKKEENNKERRAAPLLFSQTKEKGVNENAQKIFYRKFIYYEKNTIFLLFLLQFL